MNISTWPFATPPEPSSNPLAARVTRIAWRTAAAGYGSST
jgi:hypothetical protein